MIKSKFATALLGLIDQTKVFTRQEWAQFLGINEAAIAEWVEDTSIPRPDLLRIILDTLQSLHSVPQQPILNFLVIASQPAEEISPFGKKYMMPTVNHYMTTLAIKYIGDTLKFATNENQKRKLLEDGSLD